MILGLRGLYDKAFARSACHSEDRGPDFDRIKTWAFKIFEPS